MGKPVTIGIPDQPTARAIRELGRSVDEILAELFSLAARTSVVESGVSSVSGTGVVSVTPTTGDVVVSVDLSGYSLTGHTHPVFSSGASGIVPASGGNPANFLSADGTWKTPSAGSFDEYYVYFLAG